nr:T9SS type A sorting domain-containing protein [Bacteroidota bacterium]
IPDESVIQPVYPNPFKTGLTIKFDIKKMAKVKMDAYNSAGELVSNLVNEKIAPGSHSVIWNGKNNAGKPAANGVYYIRMHMAGKIYTQKAVLVE